MDAETDNDELDYRKVACEEPARRGALDDVDAPIGRVETGAVGRAGELAVAVHELAAVAEG